MGHNNSLNKKACSKSSFLTFQKGTLPLVISVPHGGYDKPTSIPDRKRNGSLLLADTYTKEIALGISRHIENYYNKKPYIIASNISRRKVDMNRSIDEGAETDRTRAIWSEYHKHLEGSIESVRKHHKYGLVVDLHGHTHSHGMIELGFLLEANDLKRNSHDLDQLILKKSSIQTLAKRLPTRPTELVKKDLSLGALISKHLSVVPSPEHPEPADELLYFTGGHITQSYHSNDMQIGLDAIQIELPKHLRFEQKSRDYVIKVLADSLIQMLNTYYIPNSKL